MPKERAKENLNRRDLMREQLAHQAAKLMAEDGITDHAHAKRKAARQHASWAQPIRNTCPAIKK